MIQEATWHVVIGRKCQWTDDALPRLWVGCANQRWAGNLWTDDTWNDAGRFSWQTVLNKRVNFKAAFANFDVEKLLSLMMTMWPDYSTMLGLFVIAWKIKDTIINAQQLVKWHADGKTMNAYLWSFVDEQPVVNRYQSMADSAAQTPLSQQVSKALKKGFKFVGPTIVQSWLEALGILDDHLATCTVNHLSE